MYLRYELGVSSGEKKSHLLLDLKKMAARSNPPASSYGGQQQQQQRQCSPKNLRARIINTTSSTPRSQKTKSPGNDDITLIKTQQQQQQQRLYKKMTESDDALLSSWSKQGNKSSTFLGVGITLSIASIMYLATALTIYGTTGWIIMLPYSSARRRIPIPSSFCESNNFTLYRSQMKDIVCNASSSLLSSSLLLPEPDRSHLLFIHIPKTGGESI